MENDIPICSLFISNNFNYLYSAQCRADTNLCGTEGQYYQEHESSISFKKV
jgi:hypothetical protein